MCLAKSDPNYYRCPFRSGWHVNREGHDRFEPDTGQEREFFKPLSICKMTPEAIRQRRKNAKKKMAEVDAIRTVNGIAPEDKIGPVLRRELWANRRQGAGLSIRILADRFQVIADDEDTAVGDV